MGNVPIEAIQETVKSTKLLTKDLEKGLTLSEEDVTCLFEGVIGLTLSPPSISGELQGRWGHLLFGPKTTVGSHQSLAANKPGLPTTTSRPNVI